MGLEYSQVILKTFEIRESVKHSPQTDIHKHNNILQDGKLYGNS